jgi:[acyl-carrier-protein] S-malonyltransferase
LTFSPPEVPVACNVDALLMETADKSCDALIRQVTGAVRWEESMRLLIARGVETFLEAGPGKVLCGLMRQIDRGRTCLNVEDEASLQKVANHFGQAKTD